MTATDDYDYSDSKALRDGQFCGLLCDEDNEYDKSEGRVNAWVEQLKGEGDVIKAADLLRTFKAAGADDVIAAEKPCLQQMVEAFDETGGNMVAAMDVPEAATKSYGILDIKEDMGRIVSTKGMVEKPAPGSAPSNLAVIGRYILTPTVLQKLNRKQAGAGGEIQLTDAIDAARADGEEVYGYRFQGQRFDCGSKAGFLQATVAFALARDDLRDDLWNYITDMVHADKAAQ